MRKQKNKGGDRLMKKLLLGLALFLGGQIGFAGWLIASTLRGGGGDNIMLLYILISLAGLVLSVYEAFVQRPKDGQDNKHEKQ